MRFRTVSLAIALVSLLPAARVRAGNPTPVVVWPGYILELPPEYCVATQHGPDFRVLYVRERRLSPSGILVGIYCGFAPDFDPKCAKPVKKSWNAGGLSYKSVRGEEGCAEILVQDPANSHRGSLHIWFGPGARKHAPLAEALLASIRPAPMPLTNPAKLPECP